MKVDLTEYVDWLREREMSEHTITNYVRSVNAFFNDYGEITKENLIMYKADLLKKYAIKTVTIRLTSIYSYMSFAGYPAKLKVKMPTIQKKTYVENVISEEEFNLFKNRLFADKNYKWYLVIKMLGYTGLRVSELQKLKYNDIYKGIYDVCGKGGKYRRVYIPDKLVREIIELYGNRNQEEYFVTNERGKEITTRGITHQIYALGKKYGIRKEVCHPHSFRHFFAKQFLKKNSDISLLADLLGHSSINMTRIYLRNSSEEQKEMINQICDW